MKEFYTYIYYDPTRNNTPFYVGKGTGNRAWHHLNSSRFCHMTHKINRIRSEGKEPIIGIYNCINEESAFLTEEWFIYQFGRIDLGTGTLVNKTSGGEGSANRVITDEYRKNSSAARKGKKRAPFTAEHRANMSAARNNISDETKEKIAAANRGKKLSDETKAKISAAGKGRIVSDETRAKISAIHKGKKLSDETKAKLSEANKNRPPMSAETRAKMSAALKGKKHSAESYKITADKNRGKKRLPFSDEWKANISAAKKRK